MRQRLHLLLAPVVEDEAPLSDSQHLSNNGTATVLLSQPDAEAWRGSCFGVNVLVVLGDGGDAPPPHPPPHDVISPGK